MNLNTASFKTGSKRFVWKRAELPVLTCRRALRSTQSKFQANCISALAGLGLRLHGSGLICDGIFHAGSRTALRIYLLDGTPMALIRVVQTGQPF